jgi:hypothetical protein
LNPLKVRDLLPSFAMEIGRSVDEVQSVISFYYKTVRQNLVQINENNIHLENLGTFYIKEKALDSYMDKCNIIIEGLSNNNIKEYASKVDYSEKLAKAKHIKKVILEEKNRRKEIINKRFNNESENKHNKNLEK